jgi:Cu-processing system ATP-binding protein
LSSKFLRKLHAAAVLVCASAVVVRDDAKKMNLLREAASDPRVTNIEITAPPLDDLYAHFLRTQEEAA